MPKLNLLIKDLDSLFFLKAYMCVCWGEGAVIKFQNKISFKIKVSGLLIIKSSVFSMVRGPTEKRKNI